MISNLLCQLNMHKSMEPDFIHLRVLTELVEELIKTIHHLPEVLADQECPSWLEIRNVVTTYKNSQKEHPRNNRPVNLALMPRSIMEQIILGAIMRHNRDNQEIWASQHWFRKSRSFLTNLVSFSNKMTGLRVRKGHEFWYGFPQHSPGETDCSWCRQMHSSLGKSCLIGWLGAWWWMELNPAEGQLQVTFHKGQCWCQSCLMSYQWSGWQDWAHP